VACVVLQVNKRLAKQELQDHSGDPFFPKTQWPPPELCPLCRVPRLVTGQAAEQDPEWNEDEVYRFLLNFYGDSGKPDAAATFFSGRHGFTSEISR
jgi:thiol oxidase